MTEGSRARAGEGDSERSQRPQPHEAPGLSLLVSLGPQRVSGQAASSLTRVLEEPLRAAGWRPVRATRMAARTNAGDPSENSGRRRWRPAAGRWL